MQMVLPTLWRNNDGSLAMWLMNGISIVSNSFIANVWPGWIVLEGADFSGDGDADILWRDPSGNCIDLADERKSH
jgi:hypothetical protein